MPLSKDNAAQGKPSGVGKGATTNPSPTPTPTTDARSTTSTAQQSNTTNTPAPADSSANTGQPDAGRAPHEGASDKNVTINEAAARGPTPSSRARPDTALDETDKSKIPEAEDRKDTFDPTATPGYHVMKGSGRNANHLGTYETEEDAQAFIDGHLTDQDINANIVKGPDAGSMAVQGSTSSHDEAAR